MTPDSRRLRDSRGDGQEGRVGPSQAAWKRETPEQLAIRLGYLPHEEALAKIRGAVDDPMVTGIDRAMTVASTDSACLPFHVATVDAANELPPCMRSE